MPTFIIDDSHFERLSPAARRELVGLLQADLTALRARLRDGEWNPEGNESYPMSAEEASFLLRGMPDAACNALRVFAENFDGAEGTATFQQLLAATGHTKFENVNKQLSWILLYLRAVTGHPDAWIVNWRARDWTWDDAKETWTEGKYFMGAEATQALRAAFEIE